MFFRGLMFYVLSYFLFIYIFTVVKVAIDIIAVSAFYGYNVM